ncbi:RNA polymerase ECF family sigma subunit [Rhizobium sp. ERR 922]|nr:RNA polymerase ECF family sigma subunit [Rhizobium sp. ERR 922]TWC04127.1 RNA polymerase ECF family sigma subunit [Rhizobium sp. ERR 942]
MPKVYATRSPKQGHDAFGSWPGRAALTAAGTHRAILAVWRIEQPRLITSLARLLRDVPLAEDLTQEALVVALERWPETGIPERPGAWLMTTARRRALDHLRRRRMLDQKHEMIVREMEEEEQIMPDLDTPLDDDIGDEMLRLIFTACHPLISREARVALALRMICGLTTEEIARAFLASEATIAQRIVRAKKTLSESGLSYETPHGGELSQRLASVLEVVYLIFNEGYTAARGENWMRLQLCSEALRLGRILTSVAPQEPEAHALLALMELNASRASARTDADGNPILLLDQNRDRWDRLQIQRGLQALRRVQELGGAGGVYALQAAIVACHARARTADETDWRRIADLYAELAELVPSPIVELNRAVAVGMAEGPEVALDIIDGLRDEPALKDYHLLSSVRGDLLRKLGRCDEARQAFEAAAALAENRRERDFLMRRAAEAADAADTRKD